MSIYKEDLKLLEEKCSLFRQGEISAEAFQGDVWTAASAIVHIDEISLRNFLENAEGDIDTIRFTVDTDKERDAILKVVAKIEERLERE
tara:strand:- start:171 stop:437 length:267 start_codon:yes stop_codon:yes gene_type:complete